MDPLQKELIRLAARTRTQPTAGSNAARQEAHVDTLAPTASGTQWLSVDEMAEHLGIGRTLAYELVRSGRVPSVKIGTLWRIPLGRLDAALLDETAQRRP